MKRHYLLPLLGLLVAAALPAVAAPRACTEADVAGLPTPQSFINVTSEKDLGPLPDDLKRDLLIGLFNMPALKYPYGSLDHYGVAVGFVVGADGRVVCASLVSLSYGDKTKPTSNYLRQGVLDSAAGWRFVPFQVDGEVTAAVGWMPVTEEELPARHVPMPAGDPAQVTITYDWRSSHTYMSSTHVELHGDGTAIFSGGDDDPLGPQSYLVDAKAVQDLVKTAKAVDFWSLRDLYRAASDEDRASYTRINITIAGKTKSLTVFEGTDAGVPGAANGLADEVARVAKADFWLTPTLATLDQLKANGFDFTSERGARFLLQVTRNSYVKDEVPLALMDLGAPVNRVAPGDGDEESRSLITLALETGRVEMARRLIAGGALLDQRGQPNQKQIDKAFQAAISSGVVPAVDLVVPFHPGMTCADELDPSRQVSVIWILATPAIGHDGPRSAVPMLQRLLDLGADINARGANGTTLLHVMTGDADMVRFMLDHGADINALDDDGNTPLASAYDQDAILLLLSRGADPRLGKTPATLRVNIRHGRWKKVKAWLETHGFADVLVAQPDDEKPAD
jgi:ankyrin repeat protein